MKIFQSEKDRIMDEKGKNQKKEMEIQDSSKKVQEEVEKSRRRAEEDKQKFLQMNTEQYQDGVTLYADLSVNDFTTFNTAQEFSNEMKRILREMKAHPRYGIYYQNINGKQAGAKTYNDLLDATKQMYEEAGKALGIKKSVMKADIKLTIDQLKQQQQAPQPPPPSPPPPAPATP